MGCPSAGLRVAGGAARDASGLERTVSTLWGKLDRLRNASVMEQARLVSTWNNGVATLLHHHFARTRSAARVGAVRSEAVVPYLIYKSRVASRDTPRARTRAIQ